MYVYSTNTFGVINLSYKKLFDYSVNRANKHAKKNNRCLKLILFAAGFFSLDCDFGVQKLCARHGAKRSRSVCAALDDIRFSFRIHNARIVMEKIDMIIRSAFRNTFNDVITIFLHRVTIRTTLKKNKFRRRIGPEYEIYRPSSVVLLQTRNEKTRRSILWCRKKKKSTFFLVYIARLLIVIRIRLIIRRDEFTFVIVT